MRQGCCHTHLASPADCASGPKTLCSLENPVRQRRRQPTTDSSFRPEAAATFGSNAAICRSDRIVMRTGARPIVLVAGIARSPTAIGKTLEASFRCGGGRAGDIQIQGTPASFSLIGKTSLSSRCRVRPPYSGNGGRGLRATRNVAAKEIPYRGGDLLRVLQQEHVAAVIYLSHFAIG